MTTDEADLKEAESFKKQHNNNHNNKKPTLTNSAMHQNKMGVAVSVVFRLNCFRSQNKFCHGHLNTVPEKFTDRGLLYIDYVN